MNNRRGFLGRLTAVAAGILMPAVGAIVPTTPVRKRGETTSIYHIDEFAFQAPLTGKSGQILVYGENGPEWRDPPQNWIVSDMRHMQMPADTSMYQQTYAIPTKPFPGNGLQAFLDKNIQKRKSAKAAFL